MRGRAPWTRLRLTRDMKSRRSTTLLNGLSVPAVHVSSSPTLFSRIACGQDWLTAGEEAVEFDEELEVDIVALWCLPVSVPNVMSVEIDTYS